MRWWTIQYSTTLLEGVQHQYVMGLQYVLQSNQTFDSPAQSYEILFASTTVYTLERYITALFFSGSWRNPRPHLCPNPCPYLSLWLMTSRERSKDRNVFNIRSLVQTAADTYIRKIFKEKYVFIDKEERDGGGGGRDRNKCGRVWAKRWRGYTRVLTLLDLSVDR